MIEHGSSAWVLAAALLLALAAVACAQTSPATPGDHAIDNSQLALPAVSKVIPTAQTRQEMSTTLKIFVIMTVLMLAPSILVMTTSFTRILIVLGLLRQAIGTQQLPPSQILVGLSLFLTVLVMAPTYEKIHREAIVPWLDGAPGVTQEKALSIAEGHLRDFMFAQIERSKNEEDVFLFLEYQKKASIPSAQEVTRADVSTIVLVPAFILSELKTAFVMGFRIYLPFLVIDMVISTVLISMGMLMLPPVLISLPFKLLLFVLADGWHLVVASLLTGFA
jgi:flagellar biosynthetic protein FliP